MACDGSFYPQWEEGAVPFREEQGPHATIFLIGTCKSIDSVVFERFRSGWSHRKILKTNTLVQNIGKEKACKDSSEVLLGQPLWVDRRMGQSQPAPFTLVRK
jgi:hypothetical protein